jgi:hypothetical protein
MKWLAIFPALLGAPLVAHADDGSAPLDPLNPNVVVSPVTVVQGDGIKVTEGTSIYPQFGIETGFVSNVFYEKESPVGAGLLRIIAEVGAGSLSPQRRKQASTSLDAAEDEGELTKTEVAGDFQYSANLYAKWDQYLSDNNNVTDQGGLGLGAYFRGIVNPDKPLRFMVVESFDRVLRATNFESNEDTNRDINSLDLTLSYVPYGRSLSGFLKYTNRIDYFEDNDFQVSNRIQHLLALRVAWKFLPRTQAYAQVSEGVITSLGEDSQKVTSYPLTAVVGINTALTVNTAISGRVGYTQGFYSEGPDYQAITGGALFDYRYSPLGRFRFMYDYIHQDSINANFYRDHAFQAWFEQKAGVFAVFVSPEVRLRRYQGVLGGGVNATRDDVILAASAGLRYQFKDWLVATAQYTLTVDQTDFVYMDPDSGTNFDPSYTRHELLAGLRLAY